MKLSYLATAAAVVFAAGPALADGHAGSGDAAAGEAAFAKQCVTCHVVVNEAGETLAGRKSKTGPNLYAVGGRMIGSVDGFRYGSGLEALGEKGDVWVEENFVAWVMDPRKFVQEATGDKKARSKMSFKVRKDEDALNMYAYLVSLAE